MQLILTKNSLRVKTSIWTVQHCRALGGGFKLHDPVGFWQLQPGTAGVMRQQ